MREAGLEDGDTLAVGRVIKPRHGHIVVAVVDGEFTVKELYQRTGRVRLKATSPTFPHVEPRDGQSIEVGGLVTSCIKYFVI